MSESADRDSYQSDLGHPEKVSQSHRVHRICRL